MTVEDALRAAASELADSAGVASPDGVACLQGKIQEWLADSSRCSDIEYLARTAEFGAAAYALGVHYSLHDRPALAKKWLRIAADYDVGDASFRLAQVYENEAVIGFNRGLAGFSSAGQGDGFGAAHSWYQRAAAAGYALNDAGSTETLEQPVLNLDCCPSVRHQAATERAASIIFDAERRAREIIRDGHADVNHIIERARGEVRDLAIERKIVADQVSQYDEALDTLSRLVARSKSPGRGILWLVVRSRFDHRVRVNVRYLYAICAFAINDPAVAERADRRLGWSPKRLARGFVDYLAGRSRRSNVVGNKGTGRREKPRGDRRSGRSRGPAVVEAS